MRRSIKNLTYSGPGRTLRLGMLGMIVTALAAAFVQATSAQCIDHPYRKTAVKFGNETRFELTFYIDDDEKGVIVASGMVSNELEVSPGEHLFRARAVVAGKSFLVWVVNEVPEGQVCTWTITDPTTGSRSGQERLSDRDRSVTE